jgi:FkbM family methyltransferase
MSFIERVTNLVKPAIDLAARYAGMDVVPSWRLRTLPHEQRLREIFSRYRISHVVDIGANEGQFCAFIRHNIGFNGRVTSFEPVPHLAAMLRDKAKADGNWKIHDCALGAAPGSIDLNVARHSVFTSVLEPLESEACDGDNQTVTKISVRLSTLDIELKDAVDMDRTFVKIDTQGFDLEVLRGAQRTIASVPALQTEVSFRPLYEGMPDYAESIQAFSRMGFAVSDLFLVASASDGIAFEFDCVMQRRAPLASASLA